ncbi:MATE family efflux transporter [Acidaminobacter sp. JC074]|uniref:MATE family efflux transporter n=1 Tax=Acidaminobacter sp. JC074 TaxID=2530199 RepID=UPI001F0DE4DE|nr:MATE family efflux transporter [Acidaminobacter sp. JC074]MCH4886392.1 MATE family efflux transporter [Acidaminobacter sp. JC074]
MSDLTKGSIYKHIREIAIPASIGYLFNTLYNVVDTYYAGKLSTDALAGMTISFPIFFILIALSTGIGSGMTALASISLGEEDSNKVHAYLYNAVFLGLMMSLLLWLLSPILIPFLFRLSGASGRSMTLGVDYTKTILYGALFFIMNSILNGFLNAGGDTKTYRNFLVFGFFLNLILDPLFIFGWFGLPKLGTVGVALATVIVQLIGVIYLLYKVLRSEVFEKSILKEVKILLSVCGEILKQGVPASLNMATVAIGVFVINYFILRFADPPTIAGYGAAVRIEQLVLLPALGLNIAVLTITGQSFGAKNKDRILEIHRVATKITTIMMIIGAIVIYPLAPLVISLFNNDPLVVSAGTVYLRIEVFAFVTYVLLNVSVSSLQGIKRPNFAVYIGLYRQIILPIILFYLLGNVFDLGIRGVWWGIVIINWSAVFFTRIYHARQMRTLDFENDSDS